MNQDSDAARGKALNRLGKGLSHPLAWRRLALHFGCGPAVMEQTLLINTGLPIDNKYRKSSI